MKKILAALAAAGVLFAASVPPAQAGTTAWVTCPVASAIDYKVRVVWLTTATTTRVTAVEFKLAGSVGFYPPKVYQVSDTYWSGGTKYSQAQIVTPGYSGYITMPAKPYVKRPAWAKVSLGSCTTGNIADF